MSSYMLWVDGPRQTTQQLVEELGIAEIQREESALIWANSAGPGGPSGLLGYWLDDQMAGLPDYRPEKQTWVQAPGKKFWIGTHNERPLKPEDIRRRKRVALETYPVQLEDGNHWWIPSAESLPHVWNMNDEGEHVRVPKSPYERFCREAERIFQMFLESAADISARQIQTDMDYVHSALVLEYRLAPPIIAALELLGDRSAGEVMAATVDMQRILEVGAQKKSTEG